MMMIYMNTTNQQSKWLCTIRRIERERERVFVSRSDRIGCTQTRVKVHNEVAK